MRVGPNQLSFAITDRVSGQLTELSYWTTPEMTTDGLADLINGHPGIARSFFGVNICYDYPSSMIVPAKEIGPEEAGRLPESLPATGSRSLTITEPVPGWSLFNVFSPPREIHDWLSSKFPAARFRHGSTVSLQGIGTSAPEGCLQADIRHQDFSLVAVRSGQLLLARSFVYNTPEDVVYYLLRTCRQFSLSQTGVELELSGLVDKDSALYNALFQYFSHTRFRENNWNLDPAEYPAHFFTPLKDLSACES